MRTTLRLLGLVCLLALGLASCSTTVGDLNNFTTFEDACDPRGSTFVGQDFDLQFINTPAHLNNVMFGAVQVGAERNVEAVVVISGFDDPNLHVTIPELLPGQPSTFAFWMDTNFDGVFTSIDNPGPDHQWLRPICPDGSMTFTHTTPFQSVRGARSDGEIFRFLIPAEIQTNADLFNTFRMTVRATRVEGAARQTRAYFRWAPYVGATPGSPRPLRVVDALPTPRTCTASPECADFSTNGGSCLIPTGMTVGNCVSRVQAPQVTSVTSFQMGGNALGELRGPIDAPADYEIEFIIDADCPVTDDTCTEGDPRFELGSRDDFVCTFMETPRTGEDFNFMADISVTAGNCDYPEGFNPATFAN
jgi:hypothetical protein